MSNQPERPKVMTQVVPSDDFEWVNRAEAPVGEDENGNPQYPTYRIHAGETVTRSVRLSATTLSTLMDYLTLLGEGQAAEAMRAGEEMVKPILARAIMDWTWTDVETGEPLPSPHNNPDAFATIDLSEMRYLIQVVMGATRTPKN